MSPERTRRFQLLSGTAKNSLPCPQCGKKRFRPYLDTRTGEVLEEFGVCNRQDSCGFSSFPHEVVAMTEKRIAAAIHGMPMMITNCLIVRNDLQDGNLATCSYRDRVSVSLRALDSMRC